MFEREQVDRLRWLGTCLFTFLIILLSGLPLQGDYVSPFIAVPGTEGYIAASDFDIAIGTDGEFHVVWGKHITLQVESDIMYSSSSDGGATWSTEIVLDNAPEGSGSTTIVVSPSGDILVSYTKNKVGVVGSDVYVIASYDSGVTWEVPIKISPDGVDLSGYESSLAITTQGTVHIVWAQSGLGQ